MILVVGFVVWVYVWNFNDVCNLKKWNFFYIIKIYKYWYFYEYFLKIGWWKKKKLVLFKIKKFRKDEKNFNIYN